MRAATDAKEARMSVLPTSVNNNYGVDEAFPNIENFPTALHPEVLKYLAPEDIDDSNVSEEKRNRFRLFKKSIQDLQAPLLVEAATHILLADADAAETLVRKRPRALYNRISEVLDPRPYLMVDTKNETKSVLLRDKTLLQVAVAAGDFDYEGGDNKGTNYGIVQRVSKYLPPDEAKTQIRAQLTPGWEEETNKKTQDYFAAFTGFIEKLIQLQVPAGSTLEAAAKTIIAGYRTAIENISKREVRFGLILSAEIYFLVVKYLNQIIEHSHILAWNGQMGRHSEKSQLAMVVGYAGLQRLAVSERPFIQGGIVQFNNDNCWKVPPIRSCSFFTGIPNQSDVCFPSSYTRVKYFNGVSDNVVAASGLGINFYVCDFGSSLRGQDLFCRMPDPRHWAVFFKQRLKRCRDYAKVEPSAEQNSDGVLMQPTPLLK